MNEQEKLAIRQATKDGSIEVGAYGAFDASFPNSTTRRGRVQDGGNVTPTLTAGSQEICVVEPIIFDDYNSRIRADQNCIGTLTTNCGNDAERNGFKIVEPRCDVVGTIEVTGWHDQSKCVHSTNGIAPAMTTMGGGGLEPKIMETICINPKVNGKKPSLGDRIYDTKGVSTTIATTTFFTGSIAEQQVVAYDEQNDTIREDGTVGTLTTDGSSPKHNNRVVEQHAELPYRIRKLTERECWRLMGVKDQDYEKVAKGQSKSSMYHLAGDSIVTTVLMAIFGELCGVEWESKVKALANELSEGE